MCLNPPTFRHYELAHPRHIPGHRKTWSSPTLNPLTVPVDVTFNKETRLVVRPEIGRPMSLKTDMTSSTKVSLTFLHPIAHQHKSHHQNLPTTDGPHRKEAFPLVSSLASPPPPRSYRFHHTPPLITYKPSIIFLLESEGHETGEVPPDA